jgi:parvulin-like peptidyl-prolyl isomerase
MNHPFGRKLPAGPCEVNDKHSPLMRLACLFLIVVLLTACSKTPTDPPTSTPPPGVEIVSEEEPAAASPQATATNPPPSPTPQLAAMVNGHPILLASFETELVRYELAQEELGLTPGADGVDYHRLVLYALIERELIRQAANAAGISITPEMVESKLADLRQASDTPDSLDNWLADNRWTLEEFKEALAAEMLVEAMIARITADVPDTAEQVRASYIQVDDPDLAASLLSQIEEGADFADLAARYSRDSITAPAGGDIGFFARGSLLVPELEDAAYQLQLDDVSDVIAVADPESDKLIYYLIKVTDRDPNRPLDAALRHQLLEERFSSWLDDQWAGATIVNFLDSS